MMPENKDCFGSILETIQNYKKLIYIFIVNHHIMIIIKKEDNLLMSTEPEQYVFEKPSRWSRLTTPKIIQTLLNAADTSWWGFFFGHNQRILVIGSAVYKHHLRGEPLSDDIDAVCDNSKSASKTIISQEPSVYNPSIYCDSSSGCFTDYTTLKFMGTPEIHVDLTGYKDFAESINRAGLAMNNSLVLTKDGVRHVLEVPELAKNLAYEAKDPEAERNWVTDKIKKGEYCDCRGLRKKDKEYFKNWKEIDPVECARHGMFKD